MQENHERLKKFYKLWLPMYKIINKKMRSDYRAAKAAPAGEPER